MAKKSTACPKCGYAQSFRAMLRGEPMRQCGACGHLYTVSTPKKSGEEYLIKPPTPTADEHIDKPPVKKKSSKKQETEKNG